MPRPAVAAVVPAGTVDKNNGSRRILEHEPFVGTATRHRVGPCRSSRRDGLIERANKRKAHVCVPSTANIVQMDIVKMCACVSHIPSERGSTLLINISNG